MFRLNVRFKDGKRKTHRFHSKDALDIMVEACDDSPDVSGYSVFDQNKLIFRRKK